MGLINHSNASDHLKILTVKLYCSFYILQKLYGKEERLYDSTGTYQNEKYKFWYFKIKDCKESGLSVKDFCDKNNIKPSTYYNYQQKIRNILCDQINENSYKNEVSFVSVEKQPHNNEKIIIIKGSIKIELDSDTPYQSIEPLLKSLL